MLYTLQPEVIRGACYVLIALWSFPILSWQHPHPVDVLAVNSITPLWTKCLVKQAQVMFNKNWLFQIRKFLICQSFIEVLTHGKFFDRLLNIFFYICSFDVVICNIILPVINFIVKYSWKHLRTSYGSL